MQGDKQNFRNDTLTFRPEVGKMLVFPSWLKHSVYPFDVDGERRSMSFNAYNPWIIFYEKDLDLIQICL